MVQCWQDSHDRLDVEQVLNSLEQLSRIRDNTIDVMSDFDQKWNQLKKNQARSSSNTTDLGSRIALAGSFATDNSSSSSSAEKPSFLDGDEAPNGTRSDDLVIDIGADGTYTSERHYAYSVPVASIQPTDKNIDQRVKVIVHQEDFIASPLDQVIVENELTRTSASPSHIVPLKSSNQSLVATSTPALQGQSSAPYFHSPDPSLSSEYLVTVNEFIASDNQERTSIDFTSNIDGKNSSKLLDEASHKPIINNNISMFDSALLTEDEDFSEFVRTSPTAPSLDFTDFASADTNSSVKVQQLEMINVNSTTDVNVSNTNFSEFAVSVDRKSNSDDDMSTFSDFVASAPLTEVNTTKSIVAELETEASNDTNAGLNKNLASDDITSKLGSDLLASNIPSDIPDLNLHNKNENISTTTPNVDLHKESVSDLNSERETNSASVFTESISHKLEPDQNQNIFSSEQISFEMPSLISGASFFSDNLHLEGVSETFSNQSEQVEEFTDVQDPSECETNEEPFNAQVSEGFKENNSDVIHTLDNNNTDLSSFDFLDMSLISGLEHPINQAVLDHNDKIENDQTQKPSNYHDNSKIEFDQESDHLLNVNARHETVSQDNSTLTKNGEQDTVSELTNVKSLKPIDDILGQELSSQSDLLHTEQDDSFNGNNEINSGTDLASGQDALPSLIDF